MLVRLSNITHKSSFADVVVIVYFFFQMILKIQTTNTQI